MEHPQSSEIWEELLAGYVLGDLTPEEVIMVNQHLTDHPELALEIKALEETIALLPYALSEVSPPEALRSNLLHKLQLEPTTTFPPIKAVRWLAAIATCAAVALISLGWDSYRLRQELTLAQNEVTRYQNAIALLRQPNNRMLSLKATNAAANASGSLVIVPASQSVMLTIQNLAPLPQGKIYRLWAFVNGQKIKCIEFNPSTEGSVFLQLPLDSSLAVTASVAITIEPQNATQPTGAIVLKS